MALDHQATCLHFDCSIKTYTGDGYGDAAEAIRRQLHAAVGSLMENDAAVILEKVLQRYG